MNLKELIEKCESIAEDEKINGLARGFHKAILDDLKNLDEVAEVAKVEIPQCAIEVIENAKEQEHSLSEAMDIMGKTMEFCHWIDLPTNQELFARAWLEGYDEIRYFVRMKNIKDNNNVLKYDKASNEWEFGWVTEYASFRTRHTRKELEEAGFGEVFTSSLFEVFDIKEGKMQFVKE